MCPICAKKITQIHHHQKIHDFKRYRCEKCDRTFSSVYTLREHNQTFKCFSCGKVMSTKSNLNRHQRTHQLGKFLCAECPRRFHRLDHFQAHCASHRKELRLKCSYPGCIYTACRKYSIRRHWKKSH